MHFSAIVTDSTGSQYTVDKLYLEYEWACFVSKPTGQKEYRPARWQSSVFLLQLTGVDDVDRVRMDNIDSIEIDPYLNKDVSSKGTVTIIGLDGRLNEYRLSYWPPDALDRILNRLNGGGSGIVSLKRWVRGQLRSEDRNTRFSMPLENIRSIKFVPPVANERENAIRARINSLETERNELMRAVDRIQAELDSLAAELED